MTTKKVLSFFHIVMINVIAVDSIRSLPFNASFGSSLIFYYLLAALLFFIPSALVAAELGTGWPSRGGLYVWVREAFGKKVSLLVAWIYWLYNLVWFPTIMALVAASIAYLIDPTLVNNKIYMVVTTLTLFWIATYCNCHGMHVSGWVSIVGAILGTLLPMAVISFLGFLWVYRDPAILAPFTSNIIPSKIDFGQLSFLSNVLFGLLGLEMVATHALEMKNPARDYPKALFVSVIIILATSIFASLAVALIVPPSELNLVSGTLQAFALLTEKLGAPWLLHLIVGCIILGSLSAVSAWIIGPTKAILVASEDGSLPKALTHLNRHHVPTRVLTLQGVVVSLLTLFFFVMPSVNSSFWILSLITAQLAMILYLIFFCTAIKLHYSKPHVARSFRIPGGKVGIWITATAGISITLFALLIGFIPPQNVGIENYLQYEILLIFGICMIASLPIILSSSRKFFLFRKK